jgi:hypothetical protein
MSANSLAVLCCFICVLEVVSSAAEILIAFLSHPSVNDTDRTKPERCKQWEDEQRHDAVSFYGRPDHPADRYNGAHAPIGANASFDSSMLG